MIRKNVRIHDIPAIIWGEESRKVYIHVHGKMSRKEHAEEFAQIAREKGCQTISFDLPQHGERQGEGVPCDICSGIHDLKIISDYAFANWCEVSLYACSLGAYFSLHTYNALPLKKCLFQSPIVDMEYLVEQMMKWFHITEEQLYEERTIETPIDIMTWDYYSFIKSHPVVDWTIPTHILYGAKDNMQSADVMRKFAERFSCQLTISENSEHPFMAAEDLPVVSHWLKQNI